MVGVPWVPAPGGPPGILILRRQPAGIRRVRSAPSGMLPEEDESRQGKAPLPSPRLRVSTDRLLHSPVMDRYRSERQPEPQPGLCSSAEQPVACSRSSTSPSLSSSFGVDGKRRQRQEVGVYLERDV